MLPLCLQGKKGKKKTTGFKLGRGAGRREGRKVLQERTADSIWAVKVFPRKREWVCP